MTGVKRGASADTHADSANMMKETAEELREAEKNLYAQFKHWEEKFNMWKQKNANHPDKVCLFLNFTVLFYCYRHVILLAFIKQYLNEVFF